MKHAAIILAAIGLSASTACCADQIAGMASVIDGDTIEIGEQRIRLFGIDAPELAQRCIEDGRLYPCGFDASRALSQRIDSKAVKCSRRDTDRYGRMVAVCHLDGTDIGRWMVSQGHAIAYRKYSKLYVPEENTAQAAHRGLWAGQFQNPADFRHRKRERKTMRTTHLTCICPNDRDRTGQRCGKRSAYMRPGGRKPACDR